MRPTLQSGVAEVNGTSLYYELQGSGPPVVLISGGGTLDRRGWDDQFHALSASHTVLRYDIRGLGKSDRPAAPFSHAEDLYALLTFLQISRAAIVGWSLGGAIAIDFALEHPAMVDRLVLAAAWTSSDSMSEANLQTIAAIGAMVKDEGLSKVIRLILDTETFIARDTAAGRERVRQNYLENHDVFESGFPHVVLWQPVAPPAGGRLEEIHVPTLIVEGENDGAATKRILDKLSRVPGSTRVTIAHAAHAIHLDQPDEFNRVLCEFLG